LTSGQRNTDHIENGQRVSRLSLPTHCFLFFLPPAFFKTNFIATAQLAHLVLPHAQADPSQNQKSHFLANPLENCNQL
jgi:hypothetical protein